MDKPRRELEDLRREMAQGDIEILKMLERRAKIAREVGQVGATMKSPIVLECERLQQLENSLSGDLPKEAVRSVFRSIYAACASLEGPTRVAYVGAEGAFGFVAARSVFGASVQGSGFEGASQALDEVARGRVDYAVVPYESSLEGPVLSTILALKQTDLMVVGQCELAVGVALLNRTGNLSDIDKIYASALDRANCLTFLNAKLPRASIVDVRAPIIACQFAAEDHGAAAIAHDTVGDLHGLAIVVPNVGDNPELRMRYAIVGTRPSPRTGRDVTSVVFTLNDEPGALLGILGHFAERGLNIRNIVSRPVPGENWDYLFYLEVGGHATDRAIVAALDGMKKNIKFVKVLGSYPLNC